MSIPSNYAQITLVKLSNLTNSICANQSTVYPAWIKNQNPYISDSGFFEAWLIQYLYENESPSTNGPNDPTWGTVFSTFISPLLEAITIWNQISWQSTNTQPCVNPFLCLMPWWISTGASLFQQIQQLFPLNFTCTRSSCGVIVCNIGACSSPEEAFTVAQNLMALCANNVNFNFCSMNQQLFNSGFSQESCLQTSDTFKCNCSGTTCTTTTSAPPAPNANIAPYAILTTQGTTKTINGVVLSNLSDITPSNFLSPLTNPPSNSFYTTSTTAGICGINIGSQTYIYTPGNYLLSNTENEPSLISGLTGYALSSSNALTPIAGSSIAFSTPEQSIFYPTIANNAPYLYFLLFTMAANNSSTVNSASLYCYAIGSNGSLTPSWNVEIENFHPTLPSAPPYAISPTNSDGTQYLYYCSQGFLSSSGITAYSLTNGSSNAPTSKFLDILNPYAVAFTPDASYAYVTSGGNNLFYPCIVVIDTKTNLIAGKILLPNYISPLGIVITSQGTAYVSCWYGAGKTGPMYTFDTSTLTPTITEVNEIPGFPQLETLTASSDGNYVFATTILPFNSPSTSLQPIYTIDTTTNSVITLNTVNQTTGITVLDT